MKYGFPKSIVKAALAVTLSMSSAAVVMAAPTAVDEINRTDSALAERVRKELVMLPWYGVFDNMSFRVEGGKVTLMGQVTRPTLQSSAGNVVKRLEGVTEVVNNIEVLPLSPFDDGIRVRVARAIYGFSALSRYSLGTQPAIRIIVKNGEVTLEGVVLNNGDRNIANIRANGVFGVFKVNNNLRTERS